MSAVNFFFVFLDLVSLVACSVYLVALLPRCGENSRVLCCTVWLIYAALTILFPTLWHNDLITLTGLTAYYIFVGYLLYHRSRIGVLYQLGFMFSVYATQAISIYAALKAWTVFSLEYETYVYITVLFKASSIAVVTLFLKLLIRRRYVAVQPHFKIRGMIFVPVISMALIFLFVVGSDVFLMRYGYEWLILYCVLILVINLYCLYFWYDVSKTQELEHRIELMKRQNELTHQFYADLESNYTKSRKIIHDIRNHLQMLEQSQKLADAQSYVDDVHEMLNSLGMVYYTDNRMLNIILNDKLKALKPEQVACHLMGVRLDFLSEMDTTTIFANLLDNALEAGKGNDAFRLEIRGEGIQDFCVVKLSNTAKGTYVSGQSSKPEHEGIGLENVRNAVEKYHGEMQISHKEQIFSVTLLFPDYKKGYCEK